MYHRGLKGETYNIGGNNEWKNIDLVHLLCDTADKLLGKTPGTSRKLVTFVKDRAGHDLRYAIDCSKIERELQWEPRSTFESGLRNTVLWYLENTDWVNSVRSGEYLAWIKKHYGS